ncbi:MAG TPA: hypothetical protein VK158_06335 [Acidobacteriota bacterium]|nr:hypothetical protein [Acidobacteriota bacterium]
MVKESFSKALAQLKKDAPERKFNQSVDLVFNLKDLDLKKPEEQVDFYLRLPKALKKRKKVCGLVGPELFEDANKILDKSYAQSEFERLTKKEIKVLAEQFDYFVAQANVMPKVAATFGRILGPRGKMPNPKAGCVVAPKSNLVPVQEALTNTIRIRTRTAPILQISVGTTDMSDADLTENASAAYTAVVQHLPKELNNLKNVYMKLTMSKPVKVL